MSALKKNGRFGIRPVVFAPCVLLGACLVLFYAYCFRVKEVIGPWPSSELPHAIDPEAVLWLLGAIVVLFVPWFGLLAFHLRWPKRA